MHGAVGTVVAIVYEEKEGPRGDRRARTHPKYVIVDFPGAKIPEESKLIPNMPRTCVPIEPHTVRCEHKCCSATQVPLRVCKAVTGQKSQGMSVGEGHPWEKAVVGLPGSQSRNKTPGSELVMTSRVTGPQALAIDDSEEDVTYSMLCGIGKGAAYDKRRQFEQELLQLASETQGPFRQRILDSDPNRDQPTLDGGFQALVRWYREAVTSNV
jgi:hypothetical protein